MENQMTPGGHKLLEGLLVRPAQHRDCEGVMNINRNIYGGIDYLQWTFHKHVSDTSRFPFVAEIDGNIVAYISIFVIDDGKSMVSEAARVTSRFEGRGIMTKIFEAAISAAMAKYPDVKRVIWTSANLKRSNARLNKDKYVKLLDRRPRVSFDASPDYLREVCTTSKFEELLSQYTVEAIIEVPQRKAIALLSDDVDFTKMGVDTILVNFEPWGVKKSTLITLMNLSKLHVTKCQKTGDVIALSFSTLMEIPLGTRYRCDFYCLPDFLTTDIVISHILYQVREITAFLTTSPVSFSFLFPRSIKKCELSKVLRNLGLHAKQTPEDDGLILTYDIADEQKSKL